MKIKKLQVCAPATVLKIAFEMGEKAQLYLIRIGMFRTFLRIQISGKLDNKIKPLHRKLREIQASSVIQIKKRRSPDLFRAARFITR